MSEQQDSLTPSPPRASRGSPIMISYEELVLIRTYMAEIGAKLDAALTLRGAVDALALRVSALETGRAYNSGQSHYKKTVLTFVGGVVTAALGGGALLYLPSLWRFLSSLPVN